VASWGAGAERLKGYRPEEILGAPLARFFPEEEVQNKTPERLLERAAADGRAEYEGWLLPKSGVPFWASLLISAIADERGHVCGFANVIRDKNDRMRYERVHGFLMEASETLAGSLECRTTLERIARLATRSVAQWCIVHLCEGDTLRAV